MLTVCTVASVSVWVHVYAGHGRSNGEDCGGLRHSLVSLFQRGHICLYGSAPVSIGSVIGWERRVLLRHYLEQGMTKTELAERFGISRQTIYRWIRSGELDRDLSAAGVHYSARAPVATKLDRYRDILVSRLGEYPDLTAVRLFEEIKAAGYAGGYTQVKEYVRKVRPRAPEEPVVRFETPPGHQGQVDFADFRLPWGKRYAFLVVLGFSRVLWLQFFTRQTMLHVFEGLEAAFTFFGGVPHELLFDQMKAVLTKDERAAGGVQPTLILYTMAYTDG